MNDSVFYKRNSQGEIIINLNPWILWRPFAWLVTTVYRGLSLMLANRRYLVAIAGVGFGFGLSVVVFQRPVPTLASPLPAVTLRPATAVIIEGLQVDDATFHLTDGQRPVLDHLTHLETSARLGQPGTMVLASGWRHPLRQTLLEMNLNQQLTVLGSNNGRYTYRVVEIKQVSNDQLPSLFDQGGSALVVYTPLSLLHTEYLVAIAR